MKKFNNLLTFTGWEFRRKKYIPPVRAYWKWSEKMMVRCCDLEICDSVNIEDKRIKFVGTVYDKDLLSKIRENAYGYFHGHEVGGTNPSLLEALGSTKLNLLLDVGFNHEVGEDAALYWNKEEGNLSSITKIEMLKEHNLGKSKYISLGWKVPEFIGVSDAMMEKYKQEIEAVVDIPIELCKV